MPEATDTHSEPRSNPRRKPPTTTSAYGSIGQTGREPNKTEAAHHMRTTLTTALAAAAAIPLAFLAAAPAAAAPGDISAGPFPLWWTPGDER